MRLVGGVGAVIKRNKPLNLEDWVGKTCYVRYKEWEPDGHGNWSDPVFVVRYDEGGATFLVKSDTAVYSWHFEDGRYEFADDSPEYDIVEITDVCPY